MWPPLDHLRPLPTLLQRDGAQEKPRHTLHLTRPPKQPTWAKACVCGCAPGRPQPKIIPQPLNPFTKTIACLPSMPRPSVSSAARRRKVEAIPKLKGSQRETLRASSHPLASFRTVMSAAPSQQKAIPSPDHCVGTARARSHMTASKTPERGLPRQRYSGVSPTPLPSVHCCVTSAKWLRCSK